MGNDIINVEDVLSFIADENGSVPVKPLAVPEIIKNVADLKVPQGKVFYTSNECKSLAKLYRFCVESEITVIFVNTEKSVLQFDGGTLVPPKELVLKFLSEISENPEELLPAFGGLTLKDVGEVAKMTMTRDEALTVRGVNETRRGYNKLKGITQVDTEIPYYVQPSYLETWMKENTEFWLHPVHPSLTPRGLLFTGSPRCLSGDTILHYKRGKRGGGRPITMQSLYRRFNGLPDGKGPFKVDGPTFLHSMREDGVVCYNQILSITKVGIQTCVRITTVKGETITLTPDHLVCLGSGDFVPAGILKGGDELRMKGSMVPKGQGGRKKREVHRREVCVLHHPVAGTKIVNGCTYKRLHFARALVEAQLNGLHYFTFIRRLNLGKLEGLKFLSSNQEVHHIDENPRNDRLSNLTVLDKIEHARLHGKVENFSCEYVTTDFVATVEPAGMRMTYDIEMKSPLHNFAASKFIVYAPNIKNTAHLELP